MNLLMSEADDSLISLNENGIMNETFMKTKKMNLKSTKMVQKEILLMKKKVLSHSVSSREDYFLNLKLLRTVV